MPRLSVRVDPEGDPDTPPGMAVPNLCQKTDWNVHQTLLPQVLGLFQSDDWIKRHSRRLLMNSFLLNFRCVAVIATLKLGFTTELILWLSP